LEHGGHSASAAAAAKAPFNSLAPPRGFPFACLDGEATLLP
jgi:hypothetical protein